MPSPDKSRYSHTVESGHIPGLIVNEIFAAVETVGSALFGIIQSIIDGFEFVGDYNQVLYESFLLAETCINLAGAGWAQKVNKLELRGMFYSTHLNDNKDRIGIKDLPRVGDSWSSS